MTKSFILKRLLIAEQIQDLAERIALCYADGKDNKNKLYQQFEECLTFTFTLDPSTRIEYENREVEIIYRRGTLLSLSMGSGEIHVAETNTGEIVGALMIAPPGRSIYDR